MTRLPVSLALAASAVLAAAGPSGAATQIGQTGDSGFNCGGVPYAALQDAVAGPPAYEVPAAGVITSWSHQADPGIPAMLRLLVLRRTADPNLFTVVGRSDQITTGPGATTFPTSIVVARGDLIGLNVASGAGIPCVFETGSPQDLARQGAGNPSVGATQAFPVGDVTGVRVNVSASLEPDCDSDGLGDETQDNSLVTAVCPPAPETTITKGPKDRVKTKRRRARASFEFNANEAGSTFECSLDGAAFVPCTSPHSVSVKKGKHELEVRAIDPGGNVGTPAADAWKVKRKKKR